MRHLKTGDQSTLFLEQYALMCLYQHSIAPRVSPCRQQIVYESQERLIKNDFQIFLQFSGQGMKPKFGIVELVLYNIAAMLASVASGYDVRLSNVSPLHPRLQPNR